MNGNLVSKVLYFQILVIVLVAFVTHSVAASGPVVYFGKPCHFSG